MSIPEELNITTTPSNNTKLNKKSKRMKRRESRRSARALTVQNGKVVRKNEGEEKKKKFSGFFLFRRSRKDVEDTSASSSDRKSAEDTFDDSGDNMMTSKERIDESDWKSLRNLELSERPATIANSPSAARLGSYTADNTAGSRSDSPVGFVSTGNQGIGADGIKILTDQIAELGATTKSLHAELQRVKDRLKDKRSSSSRTLDQSNGSINVDLSVVQQNDKEARRSRADPPALKRGLSFGSMMDLVYADDETLSSEPEADETTFLTPSKLQTVETTAKAVFPGLISSDILAKGVETVLSNKAGYDKATTLLATSLCCDEVNREFEDSLRKIFGNNFSMGGLAGFAFGGVTSFGAMAHHIPSNGSCLIVYGPHVGIDVKGTVGKLNRVGRYDNASGACCGSATAAHAYCRMVSNGDRKKAVNPDDFTDAQQVWVGSALLKHAKRLEDSRFPEVELPHALFDCQDDLMQKIVKKACGEVAGNGKIALLGGIQINTPSGLSEYFVPQKFQVFDNKGELEMNLMKICEQNVTTGRKVPRFGRFFHSS